VVDARLASADDEVDTLGGLVFLLAGHIPAKGESFLHPSGWRLEATPATPGASSVSGSTRRNRQRKFHSTGK
jgi:CBS domain containing-hemolysin-like protein